jgi:hypothetical protein
MGQASCDDKYGIDASIIFGVQDVIAVVTGGGTGKYFHDSTQSCKCSEPRAKQMIL